jgi:hypothetical protein
MHRESQNNGLVWIGIVSKIPFDDSEVTTKLDKIGLIQIPVGVGVLFDVDMTFGKVGKQSRSSFQLTRRWISVDFVYSQCWNKLIEAVRQYAPGVKLLKPMRTQAAA